MSGLRRFFGAAFPNRYPTQLIDVWHSADGERLTLRPVLPQDVDLLVDLIQRSSPQSRYRRFHGAVNELPAEVLRNMTQVDYSRCLAMVITVVCAESEVIVADARYSAEDASQSAELALLVADRWQRRGLGERAIRSLVGAARQAGLHRLKGSVLRCNAPMLALARRCDFARVPGSEDARSIIVEKSLLGPTVPARRVAHSVAALECEER